MVFGKDFRCNANCILNAGSKIKFGDDCLLSWNVTVLDGDGHEIFELNKEEDRKEKNFIIIGNHVWICANSTRLKGATVGDNSVLAAHSIISKSNELENALLGGENKIIKQDINWKN